MIYISNTLSRRISSSITSNSRRFTTTKLSTDHYFSLATSCSHKSTTTNISSETESSSILVHPRISKLYEAATNETLEAGTDLEADHPGFNDSAYRERREKLVNIVRHHYDKSNNDHIPNFEYNEKEISCWNSIWVHLEPLWNKYACKEYKQGLEMLQQHCNYNKYEIPQQHVVSDYLQSETNFIIKPVPGQLPSRTFLNGLAFRIFFCTPYVRHHSMPLYTPEPDVCHELLGHVPMLTCQEFCDFSQQIGMASLEATDEDIVKLARCYWFSVEFGLCKEGADIKVYGAGLLSSFGELQHVFENDTCTKPELQPWDPHNAALQKHPLTTYQPLYYVADSLLSAKQSLRQFCSDIKSPSQSPKKHNFTKSSSRLLQTRQFSSMKGGSINRLETQPLSSDIAIWDTWMSQWHLPSVTVALELGLFDLIESHHDGLTTTEIASKLFLNSDRGLKALLQSLVAQNYLTKSQDLKATKYKCNSLSKTFFLESNPKFYWGNMLNGGDGAAQRHRQLMDAIQNDGIIGAAEEWESGELTMERAEELTAAFHSHSLPAALGAARIFNLDASTKHILDIGGGSGCYSTAFAEANKSIHCTVLDLPQVCKVTKEKYFLTKPLETSQRLHTLSADFFRDPWPTPNDGYDTIFFSNILHDWSMDTCRTLLNKSLKTLPEGGRLLVHEILLDSNQLTPACFSIHMAVYTRGQQFFFHDLKAMMKEVGFIDIKSTPVHGYYSIVSAIKPKL